MFGYVRPRPDTLSEEARAAYEAVYCGVCQAMGEYGLVSRLFLNYDFAFLAMVLSPAEAGCELCRRACPRHPIQGRAGCRQEAWLDTAAGESVILAWWKLRDNIRDGKPLTSLKARALCLLLRRGYRKARARWPAFDEAVSRLLSELSELEREGCPSIDRTADCFARLLSAAAPVTGDSGRDRATERLLYHLGRWVYLIDAVDDAEEDRREGRYNPALARFPAWSGEDRAYLRRSMDQSLSLAGAAFQLLPPSPWTAVVENILYSGLPGVEELVFSGQWRQAQRKSG